MTSSGDLAYDCLVLAPGATLAPEATPGFNETAYTPYNLEGATRLWSALQHFKGGRVAVLVSAMPYKCPAAPYETALLLDDHLRRRGIRGRCKVEVFTPEVLPMGVAGPAMGQAVVSMLESRGIRFKRGWGASGIRRRRLLLDRGRWRLGRLCQRRVLRRAGPGGSPTALGPDVALGEDPLREILNGRRRYTRGIAVSA